MYIKLVKKVQLFPSHDLESKPKEKPQNRPRRGINRGNFATSWK